MYFVRVARSRSSIPRGIEAPPDHCHKPLAARRAWRKLAGTVNAGGLTGECASALPFLAASAFGFVVSADVL